MLVTRPKNGLVSSRNRGTAEEARHTYLATADKRRKTRAELTALLKSAKTAKKV